MGRPIPGHSPESVFSRDPGPRYAATSSTHRKVRPIIFHIKRDTTKSRLATRVCACPTNLESLQQVVRIVVGIGS